LLASFADQKRTNPDDNDRPQSIHCSTAHTAGLSRSLKTALWMVAAIAGYFVLRENWDQLRQLDLPRAFRCTNWVRQRRYQQIQQE
jgi:hypothetical protein